MSALSEQHAQLTKQLILDAALLLLETCEVNELSLKQIAKAAGIGERTIYRHYATRADLMIALAGKLHDQLELPPTPSQSDDLPDMSNTFYQKLDDKSHIVVAILNSELHGLIIETKAKDRWNDISLLLKQDYPKASKEMREMTAANIRYYLSATTWHYYRNSFKFDLKTCIKCARLAIQQALDSLS